MWSFFNIIPITNRCQDRVNLHYHGHCLSCDIKFKNNFWCLDHVEYLAKKHLKKFPKHKVWIGQDILDYTIEELKGKDYVQI